MGKQALQAKKFLVFATAGTLFLILEFAIILSMGTAIYGRRLVPSFLGGQVTL